MPNYLQGRLTQTTMALPDILYRGETKNLRGKPGISPYVIEFSDRYSVFGWGEMPDELQGKAAGLAFLAWFFFDHLGNAENWQESAIFSSIKGGERLARLAREGLAHHMIGLAGGDLRPLTLEREILAPSKQLLVKPLSYPDDAVRDDQSADRVLPFSVQFTFDGEKLAVAYVDMQEEGVISPATAMSKGKLSVTELDELELLSKLVALRLRATCKQVGAELVEGTVHFAVMGMAGANPRDFMLVDSLGPDELRMYIGQTELSQDILCQAYRATNWMSAVERAKKLAQDRGERDWKRICQEELKAQPPLLSPIVKEKAAMIYKSLARELCQRYYGKTVFASAWDMPRLAVSLAPRVQKATA